MIVSYLVSKLALSDAKDFISKNFVKLLIINIILRVLSFVVLIIGFILYSSSMSNDGTIDFLILLLVFSIFLLIIEYIYQKSTIYFIARKENDKYRTFLKWAILDMSIIKSIESFGDYSLIYVFYVIVTSGTIFVFQLLFGLLLLLTLFLPIVKFVILALFIISLLLTITFISFLSSYTYKSYFFARVSNPSNWSSLKMAFSSISGKVIKGILKLALYTLIITIILIVLPVILLLVIGSALLNINSLDITILLSILSYNIIIIVIVIYLITELIAYYTISDLYILNMIKTNSQSEMGQNAEQSK
jgi:hypothetical protein